MNKCEKKSYELLVKMEKEISWESLLKLKNKIFLSEQEGGIVWENPHLNADYAKKTNEYHEERKHVRGQVDQSFIAI